ncbi:penicillin-binding protein activator LpoB [Alcanivorax quisquiliarum]|uniref:Penicillin-binding protein activator LpoB n=1 Tax=Alcanivorax quisquiliarum TaxID=2933565 RepID=A0ABT0E5I4_9GAMM|nr:penicillin-binding protein activator LpoB [Alcanivorax quisquiliarum]MCK0537056.1 penicillin-binding protein activator LpoB [Alcanivorax quisquiliarum]
MRVIMMAVLATALLISGCTRVQYGDATATETVTVDFGSTDLQMIASQMVDDLLTFPPVVQMTMQRRPVVFVDRVQNRTVEHIDTESVTDSIRTRLIQSGKFRFVDMTVVDRVRQQMDFQTQSGMVDPATAVTLGRQIGAEFMLYGALTSIVKRDNRTKDVYYKFTLNMMNLETGIIEWSSEKEIRKTRSRSLFGL